MTEKLANPEREYVEDLALEDRLLDNEDVRAVRERSVERIRLLWKRRQLLLRVAGIGFLAATLVAFSIPKRFTSTARLMPPDQGPGSSIAMMSGLASAASGSLGSLSSQLLGLKTTGDLFIGILQSRTVQEDLATKFDLRKVYGTGTTEDALIALSERTDVSEDRKSEIITIQVVDRSPQRAQQMAQEYVEELDRVVTTLNTSSAHRERVFLENRLNQVQQDLESAEKDFGQFASKNTAVDIEAQGKAMIDAGASLEGQLMAAQTELQGLRQVYSDDNIRVRETQAQVDELNRQLRKLSGSSDTGATDKQDDTALYPTIRQLPVLGVTFADLYRRTKVQEAVFETLTQQYELAKVEEAKETPSVKVLDPPSLPEKKSYPPRMAIVLLGTSLAFVSGIVWLFGRRAWEAADSGDARKVLANEVWVDVRGSLPWVSTNGRNGSHASQPVDWKNTADRPGDEGAH